MGGPAQGDLMIQVLRNGRRRKGDLVRGLEAVKYAERYWKGDLVSGLEEVKYAERYRKGDLGGGLEGKSTPKVWTGRGGE
jgi:hypothetical protein